ncbi:V-type proton ATPase 116 kDa subunit a isoform 1-like [Tropilaelaps mercedesae]|uniref:V-type proton ATPase subunit a n=1 Tax=Tropilaelaps mercedesae TaxID=418985 RepID=A0A1V9X2N9_9ACAR|nr:V-type proton ATPase 116 kDa subunit a isoform 1-like [Tropilaelaps mercedesae]
MSSFFRSEEMTMTQMFLPTDSAYFCLSELGELGQVQIRDLNPHTNAFQRRFVNEVRRCDEMERQLRYIRRQIKMEALPIPQLSAKESPKAPHPKEMIDMEATFTKIEEELKEINTNGDQLKRAHLELFEVTQILELTQPFFDQRERTPSIVQRDDGFQLMPADNINLTFFAGVIPREKLMSFERLLWRVCKGNVFLRQVPIELEVEDPRSGAWKLKNVVIVFMQGEQLKTKVKKIMSAFHVTTYPISDTPEGRQELLENVRGRLEDLKKIRQETHDHRSRVLVAAARKISSWFVQVRKMKATFHTLNLLNMDITSKCLLAEAWVPVADIAFVQNALNRGQILSGSNVHPILQQVATDQTPPTYNRTNKFTNGFQNIIDAYGIATYREINPTPFTIITFPFLFAVMFGDAGHGLLMFLFALVMVIYERTITAQKIDNEIVNTFFGGRYIILLMGAFSMYTGLIYNDVFSKSVNIFGSSWTVPGNGTDKFPRSKMLEPDKSFSGAPYVFGLDPVWAMAQNKIPFTNSFKMKTSVVLGVMQMMFGVFLSLGNHMFHKDTLSIYTEFVPQLIFLTLIFGYLVITVFLKWSIQYVNTSCAPSLLLMLINMFMFQYKEVDTDNESKCIDFPLYEGQETVQKVFVIIAVICIPWMLLVKPFMLKHRHSRATSMRASSTAPLNHEELREANHAQEGEESNHENHKPAILGGEGGHVGDHGGHGSGTDFDFGEILINQIIHTIEYVLGSVSHTASYLRLWALSLAHNQLSEVLWSMVFRNGLAMVEWWGFIAVFIVFAAWAFLTIAVLLLMEGLSAFLHALRLHWVEFQSKFYHGEGYIFTAFNFREMLELSEAEDRALTV